MRLLIRSAGNMVDVRPWPKAFRPPPEAPPAANGVAGPRCFYFIGLAKKRPQTSYQYGQSVVIPQSKVDLTPAVNDFAHKVKDWDQRKPGMEIFVKHVTARALPAWVRAMAKVAGAPQQDGAAAPGRKRGLEDDGGAAEAEPAAKRPATEAAVGAEVERLEDLADWAAEGEGGGEAAGPDGALAVQQQLAAAAGDGAGERQRLVAAGDGG